MFDNLVTPRAARAPEDAPMGDGVTYDAVVQRQVLELGDEVFVTIADLDAGKNLVPCTMGAGPRIGEHGLVELPTIGDRAVVQVTSEGDYWVTAWTPS